jgi:uncharacterized protein (TIGR03084 family)
VNDRDAAYDELLVDLAAEEDDLEANVTSLDDAGWWVPTPADGWDVRDQIAHLALSEELAGIAATNADAFVARLADLLDAVAGDTGGMTAALVGRGRSMPGADVLAWWRDGCRATRHGLRRCEPATRVPWFAGPMSAMSFATARLMETWAHGQDVADALGIVRAPSSRLRHVADLGVRTRRYAYTVRGLDVPDADVRVELGAPDGSKWRWGKSTENVVRGPAVDFCLVVTQRRNPSDTALEAHGEHARGWIDIAQAFAGPATRQRPAVGGSASSR